MEVTVAGNPPYSACLLSVVSMQNSSNKLVIASKCEWYRVFHSQNIPMKGNGNTYRVSALDIGSKIVVRVTPTEPDEVGEALVTFGPIRMESNQKITLKNIIKSGGGKFDFESISPYDTDEGMHGGSLVVFQNSIKVNMLSSQAKDLRIYFGEQFELLQGTDDRTIVFKFVDATKIRDIKEYFGVPASHNTSSLKIKMVS